MKPKSFLLFAVAVGCGLVAMLGIRQAMSSGETEPEKMVPVLVAKTDIESSIPLTEEFVEFREMPAAAVPLGAVTSLEEYEDRALKSHAVANQTIMVAQLSEKGQFNASTQIPDGLRVLSVPVTLTTSHSGQIRPSDRVDVYVTYSVPGADGRGQTKTKLLLDFMEVFAIDAVRNSENAQKEDILAKNVSLLVTPEQASILIMAESKGELQLALRAKDDTSREAVKPLDERAFDSIGTVESEREEDKLSDEQLAEIEQKESEAAARIAELQAANDNLLSQLQNSQEAKVAAEVVPAPIWKMEVYTGTKKDEFQFDLNGEQPEGEKPMPQSNQNNPEEVSIETPKSTALDPETSSENPMQVLLNRIFVGS